MQRKEAFLLSIIQVAYFLLYLRRGDCREQSHVQ
uniref:Uncharacterized protein n=1 Tax=Arundo donax TaxID=35708 RepID=A0A0A9B8B4_ARUDO